MYIKIPGYCLLTIPLFTVSPTNFFNWIYTEFIPRFSFFSMKSRNDRSQLAKLMLISNIPDVIPHSGKALWIMEIICCFYESMPLGMMIFNPYFSTIILLFSALFCECTPWLDIFPNILQCIQTIRGSG